MTVVDLAGRRIAEELGGRMSVGSQNGRTPSDNWIKDG